MSKVEQAKLDFGVPHILDLKAYKKQCHNCLYWVAPSCGWGLGNCKHVSGKGMTMLENYCRKWKDKYDG